MTITDVQFDTIADYAHRAEVFQDALKSNNMELAYYIATEGSHE